MVLNVLENDMNGVRIEEHQDRVEKGLGEGPSGTSRSPTTLSTVDSLKSRLSAPHRSAVRVGANQECVR
jgi:hypothetical protein